MADGIMYSKLTNLLLLDVEVVIVANMLSSITSKKIDAIKAAATIISEVEVLFMQLLHWKWWGSQWSKWELQKLIDLRELCHHLRC
jgi:hypothetical protein